MADFRPGLRLAEFRHEYTVVSPGADADEGMRVTGHVQQMRASPCWQRSSRLTCTTCHAVHEPAAPGGKVARYREICLSCHQSDGCGIPRETRLERVADDSCIKCHMPDVPTDLPHFAFTHHRIGIFEGDPPAPRDALPADGRLEPILDLADWSADERRYSLGLAYLQFASARSEDPAAAAYRARGLALIQAVYQNGLRDLWVGAAMAEIELERNEWTAADRLAETILAGEAAAAQPRLDAWNVYTRVAIRRRDFPRAVAGFEQLTRLRYDPQDWFLLGMYRQMAGDLEGAVAAVRKATEIDPASGAPHLALARLYRALGNAERAAWHERHAAQLPLLGFPGLEQTVGGGR
jgi:predicted CXXCH cytochrome family protein